MKNKSYKLAGCIILYNPNGSIGENISTYITAIDKLYVIDNSEIKSDLILDPVKKLEGIIYVDNHGNKGVASALNTAVEMALNDKFEWLLTMDQDSSFSDLRFFQAFDHYSDKSQVAIFSPVHKQSGDFGDDMNRYSEKDIVMTSGNILNIKANVKIGPFLEKLFIDEVDHEYCLRAKRKGFKIIEFSNIRLTHQLGETLIYKKKHFSSHNATRVYYITRNGLYVIAKYLWFFPKVAFQRATNLLMIFVNIVLHQNDKFIKIMAGLKGVVDFLIGRYGKK